MILSKTEEKVTTEVVAELPLQPKKSFWSLPVQLIVVGLIYSLLAVVWSWPLVLHLGDSIPGPFWADQNQHIWNMWWVRFSLFDLHSNPFETSYLYYPEGTKLYLHSLNLTTNLLSLPFQYLFGLIPAFNLMMLLSVVLCGLATYLLALELLELPLSAFLAGTFFSLVPGHFHFIDGQTEWAHVQWGIFYAWVLVRLQKQTSFSWRTVSPGIFFLTLTAYVVQYHILILAIVSGLVLARQWWSQRQNFKSFFCSVAATWGGMLVLYSPLLLGTALQAAAGRNYGRVDLTVTNLSRLDLLGPLTYNYPNTVQVRLFGILPNIQWEIFFATYTLLALALTGIFFYLLARFRRKASPALGVWLVAGLLFWLIAAGPELAIGDKSSGIPMPAKLLMMLPGVGSFLHNFSRFFYIGLLALSLAAAYACRELLRRWKPVWLKAVFAGIVLFLFAAESWSLPYVLTSITDQIPPAYAALKGSSGAVVEFPMRGRPILDNKMMLRQTVHHRPILRGYISKALNLGYTDEESPIRVFQQYQADPDIFSPGLADGGALALLRSLDVGTVVLNLAELGRRAEDAQNFMQAVSGVPYTQENGYVFYRIAPGPTRPVVLPGAGWQPVEIMAETLRGRWMGQEATFGVLLPQQPTATTARLELEGVAFAQARNLRVLLNGQELQTLNFNQDLQKFTLENLPLTAGYNKIQLIAVEPATSPKALGLGNDDRLLTIQFIKLAFTFS